MFQNAKEFIDFIIKKRSSEKQRPDDYKRLIHDMGDRQFSLKCIHVAGTNGKGSVTNYLRSILQAAGYRVGSFTSPHLVVHNDRIRINDRYISDEELLDIANRHHSYWFDYDLSMFEIDMILSIIYFSEQNVDYAIYEVGIGGRLDPTNVIRPLASVIVSIGFDHMKYLGDTLEKIAFEKAGIIKSDSIVYTAEDKEECLAVFQKQAALNKAPLIQIGPIVNERIDERITFSYKDYQDVVIDTIALYQIKNAALALEVCDDLMRRGIIRMAPKDIRLGLRNAFWKGRFEIVHREPLVIIDGAHNEHGVRAILSSIDRLVTPRVIVFSALKDKEYHKMIALLKDHADEIVITHFDNARSTDVEELGAGFQTTLIADYSQAIDYAMTKYQQGSVVITGSLYFVSLVRERFKGAECE